MQRYPYVGNNPTSRVDPLGLSACDHVPVFGGACDAVADYVGEKGQDAVSLAGQCWVSHLSCGSDTAAFFLSLTCVGDRHQGPGGWAYYANSRGGCEFMWWLDEDAACYTPGYLTFCRRDPDLELRCHEYQHYIQSRIIPSGLYWIVATLPFAGERDADAAGHDKESRVPFTSVPWAIQCR